MLAKFCLYQGQPLHIWNFWFLAGTIIVKTIMQELPAESDPSESSHLCSLLWQCPHLPLGIQGDGMDKASEKRITKMDLFPLLNILNLEMHK